MKKTIAITSLLLVCVSTAFAGFSERKLDAALKKASESDKKIAFIFLQDYWQPSCPKCVKQVDAANGAIMKAVPSSSSVIKLEIVKGDRDMDKLPASVQKGGLPRIVVTDATGEKVVAQISGSPDRDKAKAFKEEVESAE